VEYLTIYRPYTLKRLRTKPKSKKEGGNFKVAEAKNWNDALNAYANKGYEVINNGTVVSGEDVIFWALLVKA